MIKPVAESAGEKIKKRIMPEINDDSKLIGTEKIWANARLMRKQSVKISESERAIESRLKCKMPSTDSSALMPAIAVKLNIIILYMVNELRRSSIGLKTKVMILLANFAMGLWKNAMRIKRRVRSFILVVRHTRQYLEII